MSSPFKSVEDFRRWADELDHPNCPVAIRTRELREEREREARKKREEREVQRQREEQHGAARFSEAWYARVDERIAEHFRQRFDRDAEGNVGPMTDAIGAAIGHARAKMRKEFEAATDKLREEFKAATSKLHDELDHLRVVNQERRELERALIQSNLDASNARITSAIEAATVKLCSEFDVAGVANELHDELRRRLPVVEPWEPERVFYRGAMVTHNNSTYQARKDTGQPPDHQDWTCIARAGRDGHDGCAPCLRGVFNAHEQYRQLDIVTCHDNAYIACRDDPGLPGHDDSAWQLLAKGSRGPIGETGARGQRGARGPRGEAAPVVIDWILDPVHYRVALVMSDGRAGPVLDLRPLFEQYNAETSR